ncbi:MAG: hypothetical protein ABI761_19415 [Saprospiraceae bacterium]
MMKTNWKIIETKKEYEIALRRLRESIPSPPKINLVEDFRTAKDELSADKRCNWTYS